MGRGRKIDEIQLVEEWGLSRGENEGSSGNGMFVGQEEGGEVNG